MGHGFSAGRSTGLSSCPFFLTPRKLFEFGADLLRLCVWPEAAWDLFIRTQPVRSAACRVFVLYFATYHPLLAASVWPHRALS